MSSDHLDSAEATEQPPVQDEAPPAPPPRCTSSRFDALLAALTPEHRSLLETGWQPGCRRHGHHQVELAVVQGLLARGAKDEEISFILGHPGFGAGELTRRHGLEHLGRTIAHARREEKHEEVRVVGLYACHRGLRVTFVRGGVLTCNTVFLQSHRLFEAAVGCRIDIRHVPSTRGRSLPVALTAIVQIVGERNTRYAADEKGGTTDLPEVDVRWWPRVAPELPEQPLACYPEWYLQHCAALDAISARGLLIDTRALAAEWEQWKGERRLSRALQQSTEALDVDAGLELWVQRLLHAVQADVAHPVFRERNAGRVFAWAGEACLSSWPKRLRGALRARPGKRLLDVDFAGLHVRIAAALSRDPAALSQQAQGDAYWAPTWRLRLWAAEPENAMKLRGPLSETEARKLAKKLTNAYLNGARPDELERQIREALGAAPMGKVVFGAFQGDWPEIAKWRARIAQTNHSFSSTLGRAVTFSPEQAENGRVRAPSAVSAVMTAVEADALRLVLARMEALPGVEVVLPLHDGVIFQIDEHDTESERRVEEVVAQALRDVCPGVQAAVAVRPVR